jgi:hypothetical protein
MKRDMGGAAAVLSAFGIGSFELSPSCGQGREISCACREGHCAGFEGENQISLMEEEIIPRSTNFQREEWKKSVATRRAIGKQRKTVIFLIYNLLHLRQLVLLVIRMCKFRNDCPNIIRRRSLWDVLPELPHIRSNGRRDHPKKDQFQRKEWKKSAATRWVTTYDDWKTKEHRHLLHLWPLVVLVIRMCKFWK